MHILIIGATRGIGKALCELALERGFKVSILARNTGKITIRHSNLQLVAGDIRDRETVIRAAQGKSALCSCIGVPITFKPVDLFSTGAANCLAAVEQNPGQKYVAITGIGAGETKGHGGFLYDRIFKPLFLKTIYADKDREEALIKASSVEWLIVRPAGLTNGPFTGQYRVINELTGITAKRISRRDVADFVLNQLKNPTEFGKAPLLTY